VEITLKEALVVILLGLVATAVIAVAWLRPRITRIVGKAVVATAEELNLGVGEHYTTAPHDLSYTDAQRVYEWAMTHNVTPLEAAYVLDLIPRADVPDCSECGNRNDLVNAAWRIVDEAQHESEESDFMLIEPKYVDALEEILGEITPDSGHYLEDSAHYIPRAEHDAAIAAERERVAALAEAAEYAIQALIWTQDYVTPEVLPDIAGWSHYDARLRLRAALDAMCPLNALNSQMAEENVAIAAEVLPEWDESGAGATSGGVQTWLR